jgi:rare lipoprotein A
MAKIIILLLFICNITYAQKASYYASKFNGKKTANGKIFSNQELTCAHKTLPFGTELRVTNIKNNKSVIVKVTDRGPFIKGRIIDLSQQAFKSIASLNSGYITVKIEIL